MSRTLKDARAAKEQRKVKEPIRQSFRNYKQHGLSEDQLVESNCPECNGETDYSNGVLFCSDCDWNSAGIRDLNFSNLKWAA
jgi:hypothetical protein